MQSDLSLPRFHNEEQAFAYVEARAWREGRSVRIAVVFRK